MAARPYRPNNRWLLRGLAATALAAAAFSGWVMGLAMEPRRDLAVEPVEPGFAKGSQSPEPARIPALDHGSESADGNTSTLLAELGARTDGGSTTRRSWRVSWNRAAKGLLPVRKDYRLLDSASDSRDAEFRILEEADGRRQIWIVKSEGPRILTQSPMGSTLQLSFQLVDVRGMEVIGAAMLVDDQGVPWGPVDLESMRLPMGWRGFVLMRGYASAPLHVRFPGVQRITLRPSTTLVVTASSEGLSLLESRLFLRVFGSNVGPSPGRSLRLTGRRQVWIRGLEPGKHLNVELLSELRQFDVVRAQVRLEKAVHELQMVARAFAEARLVTYDPRLFGKRLYVAPFYSNGPEEGTLDFRYPWRAVEWDGSGWPLPRLRSGELDFWAWSEGGRFGRLGKSQFSSGTRGMELRVDLDPAVSATLSVQGHSLLHGRNLQVVVLDASYEGYPENLLAMRKHTPGLRIKIWTIQPGQRLHMRGLWKRRSQVVIRSEEGASLWEGVLDLEKGKASPVHVELAVGGLIRSRGASEGRQGSSWDVYSKESGEAVVFPAGFTATKRALLLREGEYELRGPGKTTRTIRIVAGRVTKF